MIFNFMKKHIDVTCTNKKHYTPRKWTRLPITRYCINNIRILFINNYRCILRPMNYCSLKINKDDIDIMLIVPN